MSRFIKDYWNEVIEGNINGGANSVVHKFGENAAVGTTFSPITVGGIYRTPQAGSPVSLVVQGGNTNDTAAGTGAREITIEGISAAGALIKQSVATAGTSDSAAFETDLIRVHRAWVSASGTYASSAAGSHAGDINIGIAGGGDIWCTMASTPFPHAQSQIGAYTIPSGKTAAILSANAFGDSTKTTSLIFFHRQNILETAAPYTAMRILFEMRGKGSKMDFKPVSPVNELVGPCDIGFMGKVSATTAEIKVDFEIALRDT